MSSNFAALDIDLTEPRLPSSEDEEFDFTNTGASEEAVFNVAHQDQSGTIQYSVVRTTVAAEGFLSRREEVREALEAFYQRLGHSLVHIQLQVETSALVRGVWARPRLKLIRGGLLGVMMSLVVGFMMLPGASALDELSDDGFDEPDRVCVLG